MGWTGEDDLFGRGVGSFDVYVSIDGGLFTRWLEGTHIRPGLYPGAAGRRYAFYTRARDLAGNLEAAPLTPQAATFTIGNSAPRPDAIPPVTLDEGAPWT